MSWARSIDRRGRETCRTGYDW